MSSIDGKTTGLSKEVYGALKQLQAARKGEALTETDVKTLVKTMAKDGKIDAAELDLLDEIMANSVEVKIAKNDHDSNPVTVKFSGAGGANLKEQALEKAADVARHSAMYKRAQDDRGVSGKDELIRVLKTDQKLAGNDTAGKTQYGAKGDVASKILLQDGILLARKGLLTPDDKAFVSEMVNLRAKMKPLTAEQIARLDQIVEKALAYLESPKSTGDSQLLEGEGAGLLKLVQGAEPEIRQVDQSSLIDVGTNEGGTPESQFAKVEQNFEALLDEADSAVLDVTASTGEVGLNQETIKEQKAADVEGGRSFERIAEAIEEADRQFLLLHDNVLPAAKKQIESLDAQVAQRLIELTGKKTIGEANEALKADKNLRAAARSDLKLQGLYKKRDGVVEKLETLSNKMLALGEARIKGLKTLASIKIIDSEMKERIASVKGMSTELNEGILGLNELRNLVLKHAKSADSIGQKATDIEAREGSGTTNQELLDEAQRKEFELVEVGGINQLNANVIESLKKRSDGVCDQMITGMESLIAKYETSSTSNPTTVKLLKDELETLKSLKKSFNKGFDPIKAVKDLESSRTKILGTLKKLVPAHLDIREYKALSVLDGNVTDFGGAHKEFKAGYDYAKGRVQAAKNSIGSARSLVLASEEDLKAAIKRAEEGHGSVMEEATHLVGSVKDESHTEKDGFTLKTQLAYGSHARVYLGIGAGVGADIGVVKAKIAIGLEGALKIEKSFGSGPSYLMHADLAAKITAEITLDALLFEVSASAEIKAGLSVGLGFDEPEQMQQFGKDMAEFVGLCLLLKDAPDKKALLKEIKAVLGRIEKTVKEHKYDAKFLESKVELEVESKKSPNAKVKAELKGGINQGSYADGSVVRDTKVGGMLQLGEIALEVTKEESKVLKQPPPPHKERTDSHRVVVELKVPVSVLKEIKKAGKISALPKELLHEAISALKAANPAMALMQATEIIKLLDRAMSGNTKALDNLIAAGQRLKEHGGGHHKGAVKKELAVSIGISAGHSSHGKDFVAIEFNLEAKIDFKKDIGAGSTFVRVEAGASAKVGVEFELEFPGGGHH